MKQTPTEVFVHIFGTPMGEGIEALNKGRIGTGNNAVVAFGISAHLHRTLAQAELYRRKTGGVVVPTTTDKLKVMFPDVCLGVTLLKPTDARKFFHQAAKQEHLSVEAVLKYDGDESARLAPVDDEWFDRVCDVLGWGGL